jgi:hypothetical protein
MKKVSLPSDRHELFNKVVTHLLAQNKKALYADMFCYRTPDGLKCAAGCLLPDNFDFEDCNTWDWQSLIDADIVENKHKSLIDDLQQIHDKVPVSLWLVTLYNLSKIRRLKIPAILTEALTDSGEVENE